jgi:hypothetical protein
MPFLGFNKHYLITQLATHIALAKKTLTATDCFIEDSVSLENSNILKKLSETSG